MTPWVSPERSFGWRHNGNNMNDAPNCCPICGHEFDEVQDSQKCPRCEEVIERSEMIGPDEDYAWVE